MNLRKVGAVGEDIAEKYLKKQGYKIIERNYHASRFSEIDIIARRDNITAFIEVKTRNVKNLGQMETRPASSVTPEKQRKIIKTANYYSTHKRPDTRFRFDVIEVYIEDGILNKKVKEIKHLEGAFDLNSAFDQKYYYIRKKEGSNL